MSRRSRIAVVATLALLAGLAVGTVYRHDLGEARERVAAGSRIAQTPCGPIEYAEAGQGPALLVVHGSGGGYDQGMAFAEPLAQAGFRVVAMSRFGYLRTPLPADASPEAQADAHACLLDALGIERATVVGASAGSPSSMLLALRHPLRVNALFLLVPLAYVPREEPAPPPSRAARFVFERVTRSDLLYWGLLNVAPDAIVATLLATPPNALASAGPGERARIADLMRDILPLSARQAGLANDARIAQSLRRYDLERISVPTVVLSVADDRYGTYESARYTAGSIPDARFVGFASGGHAWAGHHDQVLAEVAALAGLVIPVEPAGGHAAPG